MKRALTLLVALCTGAVMSINAFAGEPFAAVKAIVGRLAGGYNGAEAAGADTTKANAAMAQFVFAYDSSIAAGAGKVERSGDKIKISASDASGASFALGQYMRHTAKIHISWCGNRTIETYPLPEETVTYMPTIPVRFAYNYCTLSYTMAFWSEKEWREEIDRLALSGYNVALVLQGLQEAWRVTLESVKKADNSRVYSNEQIMKYVSDEAAQAWWHMGNLEGLGGPLGGEKGDYSAPDAYAKFTARCQKDALLGEYIYAEMMKLGIQPSIQSFVGLVPDCSNQVLADGVDSNGTRFGSSENWGIIDEGGWQGYTRPDVVNPLNIAFDEMSKAWYGALVDIYNPATHGYTKYMGGDLFHEGGNKGSLTDANLADIAKKIQKTQNDYFGNGNPDAVTWVLQSWQGSPYQGIRNGLDCKKAIIQLLDKDMSTTGGVNANYWNNTTGEHIPWIWVEVLNFGGNTGMHGGARRFSNLAKIGTASGHSESFMGYGILSEGLETNPMMYDMFNDAFTREVGTTSSLDTDEKMKSWINDYLVRRYGEENVCDELKAAYQVLIKTVFDCSRYQEGCVENILCAGGSYSVTTVSKWGPKAGIEYDTLKVHEAARKYLEAVEKHPSLKNLDTFKYDFVELFLQILGERGRVINADCATSAKKRAEFLGLIDLAEKITACSPRWRLDWHEARTATVCPVVNGQSEGIRGYRRMVTSWADGYSAGQATGLREYAHRGYSGLFKDYYKKRWEWFFQVTEGTITQAKYIQNLTELDATFPTAVLTPTPEGDMVAIANEIMEFLYPPALTWNGETDTTWAGANWTDGGTGATVTWTDGMDANITPADLTLTANGQTTGDLTLVDGAVAKETNCGYIGTNATTLSGLSGITLEDLASKYSLTATMNGGWVKEGTATGRCVKFNAAKTELTVQFQMIDDGYLKDVIVVFAKDGENITAKATAAKNQSGGSIGTDLSSTGGSASVATTDTADGYGVKAIKLCRGKLTINGAITIGGALQLGNNDLVLNGNAAISQVTADGASAKGTIILGSGIVTISSIVSDGAKLVISGTDGALTSGKLKLNKNDIAKAVYVGPDGEEQALKIDANGFAKSKVGTMTFAGTVSDKVSLGWTNVTLDDLYGCVFTAGDGTTSTNIKKGEAEVAFNIGSNNAKMILTIENGVVYATSYPGVTTLTASPAVARVEAEEKESTGGTDGKTYTFTGDFTWNGGAVSLGWTGVTPEELLNYTITGNGVTGNKATAQYYYGSLNVDVGGNWFTFSSNNQGEITLMVAKDFSGTITATLGGEPTASGVTNFASLTDAITAASGAKVTVIADTSTGAISTYPTVLEVAEGVELKVTAGDFLGWNKAWELHVKGTVDLGGNALSYGAASYTQKIYIYEGGRMVNSSGHGFSVFKNSTIYVKAVDGAEPALIDATLQARENITIDVEAGAKAIVNANVMDKDGQSGIASPKIVKTGAGELVWNGYFQTENVSLELNGGTFSRALSDGEEFTLTVTSGTANITAENPDYKVVVSGEGTTKKYTAVAKTYLVKVTNPGETGQNGAGKLFETYGEAAAYAVELQTANPAILVIMWTVVDNRDGLNSDETFKTALNTYNTNHSPEKTLDTITSKSPDGEQFEHELWDTTGIYQDPTAVKEVYYPMTATEWTSAVKGKNADDQDVIITADDTVVFNQSYGPIYINNNIVANKMRVTNGATLKLGYWNNTSSLPSGMTVTIDEGATAQFDNWANGWPVKVPNATINGEGSVVFGTTITGSSAVEIGTLSGTAALTLKNGVTVTVNNSIANTLKGTGTIKVMTLPATFTVAADANVTFVDGTTHTAKEIMVKTVSGTTVTLTRGIAVAKVNDQTYGNMSDAVAAARAGNYELLVYSTADDIFEKGYINIGEFDLTGITVKVILPDARYEATMPGKYADGKVTFDPVVSAKSTLYDWTFSGTGSTGSKGRTDTEVNINCDGNNNYQWADDGSMKSKSHPYYGVTWEGEHTLATFLSAGTVADTVLVAIGNNSNSLILIKDEGDNLIKLVKLQGGTRSNVSGSILVPNLSQQHLYMITISEDHKEIKLWIDGTLWETITLDTALNLSTGLQVGAIYGGMAGGLSAESADEPKVKMIRVFGNVLGKTCAEALKKEFNYVSDNGAYQRTISSAAVNWVEEEAAWTNLDTKETVAEPLADSTVVIDLTCDTVITVNTSTPMTFEAMSIRGGHTVIFKFANDTTEEGRANKLMPVLAEILEGTTVITQYAAFETLGSRLRLANNAHLMFSYAGLDPWEVLGLTIDGQVSSVIEMGEGSTVEVVKPDDMTGLLGIVDFTLTEEGGAYSVHVARVPGQSLDITWDPSVTEWTEGVKGKVTHGGKTYDAFIFANDIVHFVGENAVNFGDGSAMPLVQLVVEDGAKVTMSGRPNVTAINGTGTVAFTETELTLDETISGSATMEIGAGQTLKTTGAIALPVKGAGTIVVSALPTGSTLLSSLQGNGWTGKLVLKGITSVRNLNLITYGNANSKIELDGVSGFFINQDLTCDTEVVIGANGLTITDGYSNNTYKFAKVSGSGTISMTKSSVHHKFMIGNATGFTGTITSSGSPFTVGSLAVTGTDAQITFVKGNENIKIPSTARFASDGIYIKNESTATAGFDGVIKSDLANYVVATKAGDNDTKIYGFVDENAPIPVPTTEGTMTFTNVVITDAKGDRLSDTTLPETTGVYTVRTIQDGFETDATAEYAVIANAETSASAAKAFAVAFDGRTVATLLDTSKLAKGDTLMAYVNGAYAMWEIDENKAWQARDVVGGSASHSPNAAITELKRGTAVWVTTAGKIVSFGKYTSETDFTMPEKTDTTSKDSETFLLANPTMEAFTPLASEVSEEDEVVVIGAGTPVFYKKVGDVWTKKVNSGITLPGGIQVEKDVEATPSVPVGKGFWFIKK